MRRSIPLGLACLSLAVLAGCFEEDATTPTPSPPKVVVAQAKTETIPLYLSLTGRTEAPNTVSVRARVDGHVETRPFQEGADVQKGDTLFVLDQRPYLAELNRTTGARDSSQASLDLANREEARFAKLASDGTVAPEQLDQRTTDVAEAQGDLVSNQGAVDGAQVNFEYTTVSAPIDGRVGRVYQDVGNVVLANETVLVDLVQMDPLYVYVSPSEAQFLSLQAYLDANPDLKVSATLVDGSAHPHSGKLDFLAPGVDAGTGTIAVRAVFPNPDKTMRPGQYAKVAIELTEQTGQITVPAEAVNQDQAGFYVFSVDKDNKASLARVTVGRVHDGKRVIETGLKEGDTVVIQGQQKVRSGATVSVHEAGSLSGPTQADE
ncbi:MAG: efflux RND transporter periplasmic adaptor subunit [Pseudomonadota bacterium]